MNKSELPGAVAQVLGIDEAGNPWVSTGDTVTAAWHVAVGEALDVPYVVGKVEHMRLVLASLGVSWVPVRHASEGTASKGGGNIRREAYEDLLAALETPHGVAAADLASSDVFNLGPAAAWATRSIRLRRGQPAFRAALLAAYRGACAITSSSTVPVLEAAHIKPFADGGAPVVSNGMLLRADVHTLFDLGRLGVLQDHTVWISPTLAGSEYADLAGKSIRLPESPNDYPDPIALDHHAARWA